jgi:hypothetical protein
MTMASQLKRLKVFVTGTKDYEDNPSTAKYADMKNRWANAEQTNQTQGLPYSQATLAKVFPFLQQRRNSSGAFRPETIAEFMQRTGFIFTRLDIETLSREEIKERIERGVTARESVAALPDAATLRKIEGLIGQGETYAAFYTRTRLPLSFLQTHTREQIADQIFQNLQSEIQYR